MPRPARNAGIFDEYPVEYLPGFLSSRRERRAPAIATLVRGAPGAIFRIRDYPEEPIAQT